MTKYKLKDFKKWMEKKGKDSLIDWNYYSSQGNRWTENKQSAIYVTQGTKELFSKWKEEVDNLTVKQKEKPQEHQELFFLLFPNQTYNFSQLKAEIIRLKHQELSPQVRKEKT